MDFFVEPSGSLNLLHIALAICLTSTVLVAGFATAWRRANARRSDLQREVAQRRALQSDTSDKLLIEERYADDLKRALEEAHRTIDQKDYELTIAREKIASLNDEGNTVYANYVQAQKDLRTGGIASQFRRHFAARAIEASRTRLDKVQAYFKDALQSKHSTAAVDMMEPMESVLELLALIDADDIPARIRQMRAADTGALIHLIPRLKRLAEEWERQIGARLRTIIPLTAKPVVFAGSWSHLEMALTTMFSNAVKHSPSDSPIEFEFSSAGHMATCAFSNSSLAPIPESILLARNEMIMGDPSRPRYGLYLLEQIADGYRAIVKVENLGPAPDGQSHVIRTSFSFSLR